MKKIILHKRIGIFVLISLMVLFTGFSSEKDSNIVNKKVLTDSVFYSTFNRLYKLNIPFILNTAPDNNELVPITFPGYNYNIFKNGNDSIFLRRYICDFDNICEYNKRAEGCMYALFKGLQLNDSIYIMTYYMYDDLKNYELSRPKIILLSFNVNQSLKPMGRIVIYDFAKGESELTSAIDSNFYIETTHYLSWLNYYKRYPHYAANEVELRRINSRYRMNANGSFELIRYIAASKRGIQYRGNHFSLGTKDTITIGIAWEKDGHGNKKTIAKFKDKGILLNGELIVTDTTSRCYKRPKH